MSDPRHETWRKEFESMGEESVRMINFSSPFPDDKTRFASVWLKQQEDSRRAAREEETLSIARKALFNSRIAIVLSAITAIAAMIIQWLIKK
jgi:hypothetical protein